ncbi:NADH-quinone oxidoreductase subunit J [Imperialibacter roseus]|uniref:NADH-quinone oxidoreductase subunit J n=1 Tax=Imperialibacter roseus TaxID=1324217 RepID=A0ABZ0ILE3_9BACT|nr:NADH-quinone oxidoreductase subunit J [Imperialibacter roseus]WOK05337.1 NADH-quinone oxidoreductase subunit J [Imperialibacter roseus]
MDTGVIHYIFATIVVLSVLGILVTRNLLYAAFLLVLTFLGVAGLFVLAQADFVAVTQLMIYIGSVLILLIFGIMLTNRVSGQPILTQLNRTVLGVLFSVALFASIVYLSQGFHTTEIVAVPHDIQRLGMAILTDYFILFEVVGVLLLVALVGAATVARFKGEGHG